MMSQTFDTSQWLAFFTKAGLPPNVAANYALIFSDNRIQLDMLMDLSKEYLYDMGIKVMGDVIAILRYAKEFHTQIAKERAIGNSAVTANKVVGRMVGHYTRPLPRISPKRSVLNNMAQDYKKIELRPKKSTIISLKRTACDESSAKKIRRVSPEEEGAYKIKMPIGTTDKTRKILQQQQIVQNSKRSVFSRLGDSAVSSSTDSKSSSVFERLGPSSKGNSDDTPSSTSLGEINKIQRVGAPLQYQGVLKITTGKNRIISSGTSSAKTTSTRTVIKPMSEGLKTSKIVSLNRINNILQSNLLPRNANTSQGILSHNVISSKVGVRSRLGVKFDSRNLARTKILLDTTKRLSTKKKSNVFDRLGK